MSIEAFKLQKLIGRAIWRLRRDQGLKQWQLAEIAGVHRTYLQRLETGKENVTIGTLAAIAGALGVEVWDFYSDAKAHAEKAEIEAPDEDDG